LHRVAVDHGLKQIAAGVAFIVAGAGDGEQADDRYRERSESE
jgi:hypothetical protein